MTIPMKDKIISMLRKSSRDYVPEGTKLHESDANSRIGLIVPELIFTYGDAQAHAKKFPKIVRWLVPAVIGRLREYIGLFGLHQGVCVLQGELSEDQSRIPRKTRRSQSRF